MAKLFNPFFQAIDGNGNPLVGAKLNFYITGTSTPKNTYSDSGLTTPNANPVVADSTGRFGPIYLAVDADYKSILQDSSSVTQSNGTVDPLLVLSTSVIAHQGSIIIGNASGADSELLISATIGAVLKSTGTTAAWSTPNYTTQRFLSGSGTYTTPANCVVIKVRFIGGGGGGGGVGLTTGPIGATGGTSTFNSVTAIGGTGGAGNGTGSPITTGGGAGGTGGAGTANVRINGGSGDVLSGSGTLRAGGGSGPFGGGAPPSYRTSATTGLAAVTNTGGGGGAASASGSTGEAASGGAGEYCELIIVTPSASYSYAVGAGGAGGIGTGTGAATGGAGAAGQIIVEEFY